MANIILPIIVGSKLTGLATNIGTDIALRTLSTTASSVTGIISYLTVNQKPGLSDIVNTLSSLDLEFTVTIIENVTKELDHNDLNNPLNKALEGVNEILLQIHKELNAIKDAIEYHNSKYFKSWRSFSWSGNMEKIKQYNDILISRYGMLLDLLKIYSKK